MPLIVEFNKVTAWDIPVCSCYGQHQCIVLWYDMAGDLCKFVCVCSLPALRLFFAIASLPGRSNYSYRYCWTLLLLLMWADMSISDLCSMCSSFSLSLYTKRSILRYRVLAERWAFNVDTLPRTKTMMNSYYKSNHNINSERALIHMWPVTFYLWSVAFISISIIVSNARFR